MEYLRIVEDQPRDLNSTNTLGDLYVRAGQVDKALEQFLRIAGILNDDGFLPKAAALYKKILKLKPDHEHALLQAAEIAASQGLLADARIVFQRRRRAAPRARRQEGRRASDHPARLARSGRLPGTFGRRGRACRHRRSERRGDGASRSSRPS